MKPWKVRLAAAGLGCTALLLGPVTLTAIGTESNPLAYHINTTLNTGAAGLSIAVAAVEAQAAVESASATVTQEAPAKPESPAEQQPASGVTGAVAAVQAQAQATGTQVKDPALEERIREWVGSLAKEKDFEAWSGAAWDVYPLGPGTHSYVVLIRSQGSEIGYMVVSSTEDGAYKLMEYGTGENPLFSMETLYHSMAQRGLIPDSFTYASFLQVPPVDLKRWYILPLQAVWQLSGSEGPRFFDAKTGEELPDISGWLESQTKDAGVSGSASTTAPSSTAVAEAAQWEPHDPFIQPTWLKGKPMDTPEAFADWKKAAAAPGSRLTYTGKWYGGIAIYPLAVSGYHEWSQGQPYIRLEHLGPRYVAYKDAAGLGGFYP